MTDKGIDFIVATNNPEASADYRQLDGVKVVEASDEFKRQFRARRRESKDNLGAETRELINEYAIQNGYSQTIHLDDNITSLLFVSDRTTRKGWDDPKHNARPLLMLAMIDTLFGVSSYSNAGAVGMRLAGFPPKRTVWDTKNNEIGVGFPYSIFCHRVDPAFHFENATEDDILMTFWNGSYGKPSVILRGFAYGKTSKKGDTSGNRSIYKTLQLERGDYIQSLYPDYYRKNVSFANKNCTRAKIAPTPQFKHYLRIPPEWKSSLVVDEKCYDYIERCRDIFNEITYGKKGSNNGE